MGVASVLSVAAQGISSLAAGSAQADGAEYQAQQAINSAQIGKTKAAQTDQYMRNQLQGSLANIMAVRASANTDPTDPTSEAILNSVKGQGDANRAQAVENINQQVLTDQNAASFYENSASNAMMGGVLGAFGSIMKNWPTV